MRLRRAAPVVAAVLALGGCARGADAVDPTNPGGPGFAQGDGSRTIVAPADRRPAPSLQGRLLDGTAYDVGTLRGQVVVLNFWGSWCAPCRAEAKDLERVYQSSRSRGVQFVGIDVKDEVGQAEAYRRAQGVSYPSLFDPAGSFAARFRGLPPTAIPTTIVIDRAGRVAARFLGAITERDLGPVVTGVAAERPA